MNFTHILNTTPFVWIRNSAHAEQFDLSNFCIPTEATLTNKRTNIFFLLNLLKLVTGISKANISMFGLTVHKKIQPREGKYWTCMAMKLPGTGSQGSNNVSLFYEQVEAIVGALFNPKSYILVLVLNVHRNIYVYIWSTLLSQQCFFPIYILPRYIPLHIWISITHWWHQTN